MILEVYKVLDGSVVVRIIVCCMFHINIVNIVCAYSTLFFLACALVTLYYYLKYVFVRSTKN